jgi:hypothetical protein
MNAKEQLNDHALLVRALLAYRRLPLADRGYWLQTFLFSNALPTARVEVLVEKVLRVLEAFSHHENRRYPRYLQ